MPQVMQLVSSRVRMRPQAWLRPSPLTALWHCFAALSPCYFSFAFGGWGREPCHFLKCQLPSCGLWAFSGLSGWGWVDRMCALLKLWLSGAKDCIAHPSNRAPLT